MFSDGKMEPAPEYGTPEGSKQRLLEEVLPALRRDGVRVHTLAFSEHADKDLLANVSRMTNGGHAFAPTIQGLRKSYRNLFLSIKKPQVLPLTKKGFPVDSGVEEATFYINREGSNSDIVIEAPTGKRYTKDKKPRSVKWYRGSGFDVITVRKPRDGNWKVIGLASSDSFATVLTNLKLLTVCLLYTSPSPRDCLLSRMPSSA